MYVQTPKHGWKKENFFRAGHRLPSTSESMDDENDDESLARSDAKPLEHEQTVNLQHKGENNKEANKENKNENKNSNNKTRRGGKKHKSNKKVKFSLLGSNSAGLRAKRESLEAIIGILKQPSCITIQETKLPKKANFKLANYQVFQKNRNSSGGGLLTAVDPNLNPMLITSKNEEAEILTVQLELNDKKLRVINGYGPQEDDTQQNRLNFWLGLEEEIISAKSESCMVIIQMDANAKVGRNIISQDPNNVTDSNGALTGDDRETWV